MFLLSAAPIDPVTVRHAGINPDAGGIVSFEGRVRAHNAGKPVSLLEYEAYETLALREGEAILAEARQRYEILDICCVHRTGPLRVGELAVWVEAQAAHRDAAFHACRYVIDAIKHRLPVWKRESYADGTVNWVNCQKEEHRSAALPSPTNAKGAYYARQMALPEVGASGQRKLGQAKVLVVGAGGLGSPALLHLAGAGVGTLGLCEFDTLQVENLHRQILYRYENVGKSKAALAARQLEALNPEIRVVCHETRLTEANAAALFTDYNLVLDCTDNFQTRFLLSDTAVKTATPLLQASVYQYEGQLSFYVPESDSACLRCLWPEAPAAGFDRPCSEAGVLGSVPGALGALQATEALKWLLSLPTPLENHWLILDLLRYETRLIRLQKLPECPTCGNIGANGKRRTPVHGAARTSNPPSRSKPLDSAWAQAIWVDIREPHEREPLAMPVLERPLSQWDNLPPLDAAQPYLLVCQFGLRSRQLAVRLQRAGWKNIDALNGGLEAWRASCHSLEGVSR